MHLKHDFSLVLPLFNLQLKGEVWARTRLALAGKAGARAVKQVFETFLELT